VLDYFLKHPETADSVEGIARWRLLEQLVQRTVIETTQAIGWLVEHDYLTETVLAGGRRVYRLHPAKRDEAARLLLTKLRPGG
jgi:hypothetical protein